MISRLWPEINKDSQRKVLLRKVFIDSITKFKNGMIHIMFGFFPFFFYVCWNFTDTHNFTLQHRRVIRIIHYSPHFGNISRNYFREFVQNRENLFCEN